MRYLGQMKWGCVVAVLFWASLASAQASKPVAQDVDTHDMPTPAHNPITGEAGTWIPDWLKLRHLEDNERLKQCTVDLSLADDEYQLHLDQIEELTKSLRLEMKASAKLEASLAVSTADRERMQAQVHRRTTAMWVLLGGLAVVTGAFTFEVAR